MKKYQKLFFVFILVGLMLIPARAYAASYSSNWRKWNQSQSGYSSMVSAGCRVVAYSKCLKAAGFDVANPDAFFEWGIKKGYYTKSNVGENCSFGVPLATYIKSKGGTCTYSSSGITYNEENVMTALRKPNTYVIATRPATSYWNMHTMYVGKEESLRNGTPTTLDGGSEYIIKNQKAGYVTKYRVFTITGGAEQPSDEERWYSVNDTGGLYLDSDTNFKNHILVMPYGAKVKWLADATNGNYKVQYYNKVGYAYPEYLDATSTPSHNPQGECTWFSVKTSTRTVYLEGYAFDRDDYDYQLQICVYIDKDYDNPLTMYTANSTFNIESLYPGVGSKHGLEHSFSISNKSIYGNHSYEVIAVGYGKGSNTVLRSGTAYFGEAPITDTQAPSITNISISNITPDGYRVACTVTDNVGVTKVQFPTWTHYNDQDDLIWHEAKKSGDTYYYDVKISEHNNERGLYATHIYAYDAAGNSSNTAATNGTKVPSYYHLDVNGSLDTYPSNLEGGTLPAGATVDVYINGSLVANDVNDYYEQLVEGDFYEITDIKAPTGTHYSRLLEGSLTGVISSETKMWLFYETYWYIFDVNGYLDTYPDILVGNELPEGVTVDVYINGSLVANDVNDFCKDYPYGTEYEVKDIKCSNGVKFTRMLEGELSGSLTYDKNVWLFFESCKHSSKIKTVSSKYLKSAANCEKAAIYYYECGDCHKKTSSTYSYGKALGHKEKVEKTTATVNRDGLIVKTCSRCKKEVSRTKIPRAYVNCCSEAIYTGKAIKPVFITDSKYYDIPSNNYSITYKNNTKVGIATYTVTFKNNYSGSKTYSFTIVPDETSLLSVKAGVKSLTVKWKKVSTDYTGYQIQYATSSNFKSGAKTVTVPSKTATSKQITGLKSGKNYYVRIRVYKTVKGKTYFSDWSDAKKVKVK